MSEMAEIKDGLERLFEYLKNRDHIADQVKTIHDLTSNIEELKEEWGYLEMITNLQEKVYELENEKNYLENSVAYLIAKKNSLSIEVYNLSQKIPPIIPVMKEIDL